ncbi:hypothetical protein OQA88_13057 [Cercophora sp. LCS_1]
MATPNESFEFVNGPARHRTKRIEPEEWEKWRPRITELFLEVKLAEVVTRMQLEYGFCANERQYTHHLGKWGVKKQGRGAATTAAPLPADLDDTSGPGRRDPHKRRRHSAGTNSVSSADSALLKPPRKKVEQDAPFPNNSQSGPSPEDSAHGWTEDECPGTASTSPSSTNTFSYIGTDSPVTPITAPDSVCRASLDDSSASPEAHSGAEIPPQASGIATSPIHPVRLGNLDALGPQWPLPPIPFTSQGEKRMAPLPPLSPSCSPGAGSPPPVSRVVRAIDRNRPVETFSAQDIADIKYAAECLSMFCCNREAFELYTTILKRQLSDDSYRDNTFWYLIIQCAHTASIPAHVEVIQNIIRAELGRLQDSQPASGPIGSPATNMLLHMLLAFTSSRTANAEDMALSISKARTFLDQKGLAHLPSDDRSLDLPVYRNILRLQAGESCDLTSPVAFEFTPFGLRRGDKTSLEDWILSQTPGPFELQKNGRMGNPCIRSCISWCEGALSLLRSTPLTPGIGDFCTDRIGMAWAEANALFIILWERWVRYNYNPPTELTWVTATQERMGISATELLLLVCRAIHDSYYPWNSPAKSNSELMRRLRKKAEELTQEPDSKLARRVLKQYISRNTVTSWPSWRSAVQRLEKARMMRCFEDVLLVRFPRLGATRDLITSVLIPLGQLSANPVLMSLREEDEGSFPVVEKSQQPSPTLASSLSSVDLSTFRKTGVSAMLRLSKLARGSSSASSRGGSGTKVSIAGASDISNSFRSLSISGDSTSKRRASSQIISTAAFTGDRLSGQRGEERELDSDRMTVATWI